MDTKEEKERKEEKDEKKNKEKKVKTSQAPTEPKTVVRASKYTIVGIILTVFNFCLYTVFNQTLFSDHNELLWLDSLVSTTITSFLAYFLHSKITWRERNPSKTSIIKFIIWNLIISVAISPFFTWLFGFITPVYQFAFNIISAIHIPFDYAFVESTGIFCFTTLVTITLNYFFYDKFVFGQQKD